MAKSMRSKSKRAFRSKKRETGVYAATEAARLHRLNSKLVATVTKDKDGDISLEDAKGDDTLGWFPLPIFGLLDQNDITVDSMDKLSQCSLERSNGEHHFVKSLVNAGFNLSSYFTEPIRSTLRKKSSDKAFY